MIKIIIDNEHDEDFKVDKALLVIPSYEDDLDSHSILVGEFEDEDILNYVCHAVSTGLRTVLRCDNDDLQRLDFSDPKQLTTRMKAFEDIWSQMKLNVFMEVFEEVIQKAIKDCENPEKVMEALIKTPEMQNIGVKMTKIDINEFKNKAKEVLGVDSAEDIEVDVEELMKQIGKEFEQGDL